MTSWSSSVSGSKLLPVHTFCFMLHITMVQLVWIGSVVGMRRQGMGVQHCDYQGMALVLLKSEIP